MMIFQHLQGVCVLCMDVQEGKRGSIHVFYVLVRGRERERERERDKVNVCVSHLQ